MPGAVAVLVEPRQPSTYAEPLDPRVDPAYAPDGAVAMDGLALSPVTAPQDMHGPDNEQLFQTGAYPERDDGPQWSIEQGIGRSPGQQWPHMPHVEQYNFESTCNIGATLDGGMIPSDVNGHPVTERPSRAGWALTGPQSGVVYYYGQGPQQHRWANDPISINVPDGIAYTEVTEVPS